MASPLPTHSATHRVVLIDFDWHDLDYVPQLLRRPEITIGMVAGARPDDVGVRVAELCGVRQSVDLADLTREFFDLAIVGESSPRRAQVERLLQALGTPVTFPREIANDLALVIQRARAVTAPPAENGTANLAVMLDHAIPDLGFDDAGASATEIAPTETFSRAWPERDDRAGLERVLAARRESTSATAVELHSSQGGRTERWVGIGPEDPLLRALAHLALDLETAQIVSPVNGDAPARIYGAWPFRVEERRVVLAVAGIDGSEERATWERWVRELKEQWTRDEQRRVAALAGPKPRGWLDVETFRRELDRAVDRNQDHHAPCAVHRLRFQGSTAAVERLCGTLPAQLRAGDGICRPAPTDVLLLWSGARHDFTHLRRRLIAIWEHAWRDAGEPGPAPPIMDERIELDGPEDMTSFREAASHWISAGP